MRFVGSTSPLRNLLQNCVAAADLARRAGRGQSVVIDSCGFVSGRLAEGFQYSMIDLLRPDLIVILGGSAAIERICVNFSQNRRIEIDRIPPAVAPSTLVASALLREPPAAFVSLCIAGGRFHGLAPPADSREASSSW